MSKSLHNILETVAQTASPRSITEMLWTFDHHRGREPCLVSSQEMYEFPVLESV